MQLINFKPFFKIEGAFRLTCDTSTGPVALESQSTQITEEDENFARNWELAPINRKISSLVLAAENTEAGIQAAKIISADRRRTDALSITVSSSI